jgi:hypothetical protein
LVAAGAVVAAGVWIGIGLSRVAARVKAFERVQIPGEHELMLGQPGGYLIYYEGPGADQGVVLSCFNVTLTPTDGKAQVRISSYEGSLTYSVGGHAGFAVFTFEIDEPRVFLLNLEYGGEGPTPSQVAVGASIAPTIVATVVGGIAWFLAAVVVAVVVLLQRRRARRALQMPAPEPPS